MTLCIFITFWNRPWVWRIRVTSAEFQVPLAALFSRQRHSIPCPFQLSHRWNTCTITSLSQNCNTMSMKFFFASLAPACNLGFIFLPLLKSDQWLLFQIGAYLVSSIAKVGRERRQEVWTVTTRRAGAEESARRWFRGALQVGQWSGSGSFFAYKACSKINSLQTFTRPPKVPPQHWLCLFRPKYNPFSYFFGCLCCFWIWVTWVKHLLFLFDFFDIKAALV